MKKALITGSEGFVGRHLWKELEINGYKVFGTSLNEPEIKSDKVFVCDITDTEKVDNLMKNLRPDYIFHLAAQPSPHHSWTSPKKTFEINTIGTVNLLESIKNNPGYHPRTLLVGSSVEYGDVPEDKLPITEETGFDPRSPYAISKLACYYTAKAYVRVNKIDIVYSASFSHTGPGQGVGFLASDIATQIVEIEKGNKAPLLLTGYLENLRDYTDVRDVVRAYRLLLDKGKTGERYNVCSGKAISTGDIYQGLIKNAYVKIEHSIDPTRNNPSDVPVIIGSHAKITTETGWTPEIPIEQTLKDLLDWYRSK